MQAQQPDTAIVRTGWSSWLGRLCLIVIVFESITGLAVTYGPFHPAVQWGLLAHTALGALTLGPVLWYAAIHWIDYRSQRMSQVVLLGYVGVAALLVCSLSGVVLTWEGLFGVRTTALWRQVHLLSTFVTAGTALAHVLILVPRLQVARQRAAAGGALAWTAAGTAIGLALVAVLVPTAPGTAYVNEFPEGYSFLYGEDRPFAPSLARTSSGGALDARTFAGSESCGTAGCHAQILEEWRPSAHRYAAMDPFFQTVQTVMAKQNGPESTRYCGGCHDPISLFSGAKTLFVKEEELTAQAGYQEGVSCLVCHGIRETDIQGNANYVISPGVEYLWQPATAGLARVGRDFLIRTYPEPHNSLSKGLFKAPEYCAACHKQFVDQEVNQVGWVQLQNQYDNWAASHWRTEKDPRKTVECRECHMPLVDSDDPAAGDVADYNRSAGDGKHRSHRFAAANTLVPALLKLPGHEEHVRHVERWLKGDYEIPEISEKWATGPAVKVALEVPESVPKGQPLPVRAVFTSNKVGHDFPTGPLDIIQSWLELRVTDGDGREVFHSGTLDEKNFIEPGSFLFKAEPIDQQGNLIDRHNLWEMVGVRYRRALFPGFSDSAEFLVDCGPRVRVAASGEGAARPAPAAKASSCAPGSYTVTAILQYRKVDQYLINFLLGEDSGLTAPLVELGRASATVEVSPL